jgi:hypothetical protein
MNDIIIHIPHAGERLRQCLLERSLIPETELNTECVSVSIAEEMMTVGSDHSGNAVENFFKASEHEAWYYLNVKQTAAILAHIGCTLETPPDEIEKAFKARFRRGSDVRQYFKDYDVRYGYYYWTSYDRDDD